MRGHLLISAFVLAAGAFAQDWLHYKLLWPSSPLQLVVFICAFLAIGFGIWVGFHLKPVPVNENFERNNAAQQALGISARESEVLDELALGFSNKEIARRLGVSPNTVKTHLAKLYEKLGVSRRTQAIQKARDLEIIP